MVINVHFANLARVRLKPASAAKSRCLAKGKNRIRILGIYFGINKWWPLSDGGRRKGSTKEEAT